MQDKRCFTYPWFVLDNIVLFSDDCTSARQTFWYEKNLQGDVVAVYSHDGVKLVSYAYDAWGNTTTIYHNGGSSTGARYNPIRYRGYYYDSDLGMYWLQTRLYNPSLRRFMSPDSYVSTGTGILGYNMYAYCNNDPVNNVDYTGNSFIAALLVFLLCGTATVALSSCGSPSAPEPEISVPDDIHMYEFGEGSKEDGKVNVEFYPNNAGEDGTPNPMFVIYDSHLIKDEQKQRAILEYIMASEYYSQEVYGRTLDSMMIEWDAHNGLYNVMAHDRLADTNFDRNAEGMTLIEYYIYAGVEYLKEIISQ